jgi:hypothetical protein
MRCGVSLAAPRWAALGCHVEQCSLGEIMIRKFAAVSAAMLIGAMSQIALAQAPAGTAAPAAPAAKGAVAPAAKTSPAPKVGAKAPPPVNACKGLTEADCGTKAEECSYVKAYKTKAGKTVAGYCKSKPKPKAAKAAAKPPAPATTAVKPSTAPTPAPKAPAAKN